MNKVRIENISGMQIFDSRGTPTVEAKVLLSNGIEASAAVPSGASTGKYEAYELRDIEINAYGGKGVLNAVNNINTTISRALQGELIKSQQHLDGLLIDLDGTENKMHLGANAVLAVSLALAKVGAELYNMPLFQYIGGINGTMLPLPMMNILNGGAHADNNIDIQEFMIVPTGAIDFEDAMKMGTEVYKELGKVLRANNFGTAVGDEGGYAPNLENDEAALDLIVYAIEKAGYKPGKDIKIALDIASSDWYEDGVYTFPKKKIRKSGAEMIDYYTDICSRYPIVSIEDPFSEDDFGGFATFTKKLGKKTQVVGDDLFVTNTTKLKLGITQKCGNAILIKPNQIGTLTETMQVVQLAKQFGYGTIISHRSGETEDTSIADIAVGLNAGQIKTGAPARTDRVCKYNRLLRIERELGIAASYGLYTN